MSPLERRYRRLLRLLPRQHRAARGEELLGLLLDLDGQRTRPSARQALGLIGLAIRLRLGRLPADGNILFSAFLVTFVSMELASRVVSLASVASDGLPREFEAFTAYLLISALAELGVVVAWILGARRAALALQLTAVIYDYAGPILFAPHRPDLRTSLQLIRLDATRLSLPDALQLAVVCLLAVATRRRWATPRARPLWLAAVAQVILAWAFIDLATRDHRTSPAYAAWVLASVIAAGAAVLLWRRAWPLFIASVLVGTSIAMLLPVALLLRNGSLNWLAGVAVGSAVLVAADWFLSRQLPDRLVADRAD
jgi:hypothetical protein